MSQGILIVGTGAQTKYALETFRLRKMSVLGLIALPGETPLKRIYDIDVIGSLSDFENIYLKNDKPLLLLSNSDNKLKEELAKKFSKYLPVYANAIHPMAVIATTAVLGSGIIINANAVLQPNARIGNHVMIHAGVIVEHDCVICDFVNLAPRAVLAGYVKIGKGSTVYTGSVIIPRVEVGEYSKIGAGGVVLKKIGSNKTVAGVPAREVKSRKENIDDKLA
jgi:sugar O-acyltransferase (sialic acid O-acetyltransferase NeuD family)